MSTNCLVTKLKGTVDNSDLLKLGEVEVSMSPADTLGWYATDANPVRLRNKTGYFVNKTTGENETYISIGSTTNYSLPKRDTVVIENPEALIYMRVSCALLDSPYNILYMKNCVEWTIEPETFKAPSLSFNKAIDGMLSNSANNFTKISIRDYNFDGQNFNALADHPLLSKFNASNTAKINVARCRLTIDVADIAKLPSKITSFELLGNYCTGTIESLVAAARISWPNKSSIDLQFSCKDDRQFFTATFDGQNITSYENTNWKTHTLSWTADTITFMGKTISA